MKGKQLENNHWFFNQEGSFYYLQQKILRSEGCTTCLKEKKHHITFDLNKGVRQLIDLVVGELGSQKISVSLEGRLLYCPNFIEENDFLLRDLKKESFELEVWKGKELQLFQVTHPK